MATCLLCPPGDNTIPDNGMPDHVRLIHPDLYDSDPLQVWPDGAPAVEDHTLQPEDFTTEGTPPDD